MIIDSFLAFNEIELANFRINYLWDFTEKVIIGESNLTHSGMKKPMYFTEWLATRPDLKEKVHIVEIKLDHLNGNWEREIASREFVQKYLRENFGSYRAILSDLDEIPTKEQVVEFLELEENVHFPMRTYYRKANFALTDAHHKFWNYGVMIYDHANLPSNGGRYASLPSIQSSEAGGHFSYLGMNRELVSLKLESFAHSELGRAHLKSSYFIEFCNRFGIDHLGRFQERGMGIFEVVNSDAFSRLQSEMYKFQPLWFHSSETQGPTILRGLASAVVSHATKNVIGSVAAQNAISQNQGTLNWIFKAKLGIFLQVGRKFLRTLGV